jgi:ADP-ribose pyrophosphatase YjhB (NUDIX family)
MSSDRKKSQSVPAVAAVMAKDGKILLIKRGKEPSKGK